MCSDHKYSLPQLLSGPLSFFTHQLCVIFLKDVWPSSRVWPTYRKPHSQRKWTMPLAAIHWQELLSKERDILPTSCSVLGFCLAWASPDLCTLLWPLWVLMCCCSIIYGEHWLLVVCTPSGSYALPTSSSIVSLEPRGQQGDMHAPFRAEHSIVSYSPYLGQL